MKTMKKFLAAAMAVTSVMAIAPMSAFAENETSGTTTVTFNASPGFTITIPASVNLNGASPTATIKAENVSKSKQINVTLDSAAYVEKGDSIFIAKNGTNDSQVTYTIGKGEATTGVKVGDTVAEFTKDGEQVLSFSTPTGATFAGKHTEVLTFGVSVESEADKYLNAAVGDTVTNTSGTETKSTGTETSTSETETTPLETTVIGRLEDVSNQDNIKIPVNTAVYFDLGENGHDMIIANIESDSPVEVYIEGNYLVIVSYQADAKATVTLKNTNETFILNVTSYDADKIVSYKYQATNKILFRFSHDETEFQPDILIEELQRCAVYDDNSEGEWETVTDLNIVSFNGQTPKSVFDSQDEPMCRIGITAVITAVLPNGKTDIQEITVGDVLIAVKGDANIDGLVNAKDAAKVLVYAADQGAGKTPHLYDGDDTVLELFSVFLANVNGDSSLNARDAAYILIYSAEQGAGKTPNWDKITSTVNIKSEEEV